MDAVQLEDGHASVDLKRCIGCGLCVPTCPERAIGLTYKDNETVPPKTQEDFYDTILADKSTFAGKIRNASLKALLRVVSRLSR